MDKHFFLFNSDRPTKKYIIKYYNSKTGNINTIHFGLRNSEQYPDHKNIERRDRYILRHQKREDWTQNGIYTPGFWSRWLLWNLPNLNNSIKDTESKFNIKIYNKID